MKINLKERTFDKNRKRKTRKWLEVTRDDKLFPK